jgi:serine/threonine protein kinase
MVVTMNFGATPMDTMVLDSKPVSRQSVPSDAGGTIEFDTARSKNTSTTAGSQSGSQSAPAATVRKGATPTAIGRYTIKDELGAGSFGLVYRCFDEDLKREVAIKVPHLNAKITTERIKEFLHEAQSAARLRHPGIVTVLDTSQTEDGRAFIVYEFIAGRTLQNHFDDGKYSIADAVRWLADTSEALHHAHKNGIVHRDIKPANILIDPDGRPHIADFGLAKMDDQFFKNDSGKVLGTVAYMSPEQAAGQSHWATPQTDIYSLGVMLYQLLTKRLPFTAKNLEEVLLQIRERVPAPPRTIDDKIPKGVEDVCRKAMAKNPADRYTTAADMAADLRAAMAVQPPKRRTPWVVYAAVGLCLLPIFASLAFVFQSRRSEEPKSRRDAVSGATNSAMQAGAAELPATAPRLEIHYQGANEQGVYHPMTGTPLTLHEGDKVQLHVSIGEPRYIYLYWYDAAGKPKRLWPETAEHQQKLTQVSSPEGENEWHTIDANRGAEMAVVAARNEPLSASELAEFEAASPHTGDAIRLQEVFQLASADVERGLGGVVKSQKNPLAADFRETMQKRFDSFHGLVIPHE